MKYIKNIIESIRATRRQKRKLKEVKTRLMASHVEATPIPNIYKVVFSDFYDGKGPDRYNLYDAKEDLYLFNICKAALQQLQFGGLYFIREYDRKSSSWFGGIFDITTREYVFLPRQSLHIKQFPDSKADTMLLQTNNELIVFNLKTKLVERTIGI